MNKREMEERIIALEAQVKLLTQLVESSRPAVFGPINIPSIPAPPWNITSSAKEEH